MKNVIYISLIIELGTMEYFVPKKVSLQNNLERNLQTPLIFFFLDVNF